MFQWLHEVLLDGTKYHGNEIFKNRVKDIDPSKQNTKITKEISMKRNPPMNVGVMTSTVKTLTVKG